MPNEAWVFLQADTEKEGGNPGELTMTYIRREEAMKLCFIKIELTLV